MKVVELSQHLHKLREARSGRPRGAAMTAMEVWACVPESQLTDIQNLLYFDRDLPRPVDGLFARLAVGDDPNQYGVIVTNKGLPRHWKEFVAIKEMMHCWSSKDTFNDTPSVASDLMSALVNKAGRYTVSVVADRAAILAAAEVILPHEKVQWHLDQGHDHTQIAASHGLHPDVASLICQFDVLHARRNGASL
jgi:hypothetical protein